MISMHFLKELLERMIKRSKVFSLGNHSLILVIFSVDFVLMLLGDDIDIGHHWDLKVWSALI